MSRITYRWKYTHFMGPRSFVMSQDQTWLGPVARRTGFSPRSGGGADRAALAARHALEDAISWCAPAQVLTRVQQRRVTSCLVHEYAPSFKVSCTALALLRRQRARGHDARKDDGFEALEDCTATIERRRRSAPETGRTDPYLARQLLSRRHHSLLQLSRRLIRTHVELAKPILDIDDRLGLPDLARATAAPHARAP